MTTHGINAKKARSLVSLLLTLPTFASATWVMQPTDSAVRGSYAEWEIAIKEPQTTSSAFAGALAHAPSWKALEVFLRTTYFDREAVVDRAAHTLRISDRLSRLPVLGSEYRARFKADPPSIPDTPFPDDVAQANAETATLANHPVATVHVAHSTDGRPSLVCKVEGAVVLTAWGPQGGNPLRGTRTLPVDGVDVVLTDIDTGMYFQRTTDAKGHYSIDGITMPPGRDVRRFSEAVLSDGAPVPAPRPIAECHV